MTPLYITVSFASLELTAGNSRTLLTHRRTHGRTGASVRKEVAVVVGVAFYYSFIIYYYPNNENGRICVSEIKVKYCKYLFLWNQLYPSWFALANTWNQASNPVTQLLRLSA